MKKHLYSLPAGRIIPVLCILSVLAVSALALSSCHKNTLNGNVARPSWTAPAQTDMTSSMTAVVEVNLAYSFHDGEADDWLRSEDDLLAAFSDETCLGVGKWVETAGAYWLYIAAPVTGSPSAITLRYYSAHYKNLFEAADAFVFQNDGNLGTPDNPFLPIFVVEK